MHTFLASKISNKKGIEKTEEKVKEEDGDEDHQNYSLSLSLLNF